MKFKGILTYSLVLVATILMTSCGILPELPSEGAGPKSEETVLPWNIKLQNEGQGALSGLGAR